MREMKDSGVEWIGEVPLDWQQTSLLNVLRASITDGPHETPDYVDEGVPFISVDSLGIGENVDLSKVKKYISEQDYYKFSVKAKLENGDILFTKSATIGKTAIVNTIEKYMIWSPIALLKPNEKMIENKYLYYLLNTSKYIEHVVLLGTYNTQVNVGMRTLEKSKIPLPNERVEQKSIVSYLDQKVAFIDNIIEKTKESIEEYKNLKQSIITEAVTKGLNPDVKMKASGIEWIGEIPEHWEILRGKNTLGILNKPILESDEIITCFRDGEVTLRKNRREDGFTMADKEIGYQGIDVGDLVIHGMDGFAGAIGISDSRGKATPVLNVCDSKNEKKFLMYYLRSMAYSNIFLATSTGIRVRSCDLSWNKLSNLPYPIPPISEQKLIVRYINNKLIKINEFLVIKNKLFEELESYKKSLIYEVVTGKKEIPTQEVGNLGL